MIPLLLLILLLGGCATRSALTPDEYGKAALCHWYDTTPFLCTFNPNRVTMDQETLADLLNQLDDYRWKEYHKRAI